MDVIKRRGSAAGRGVCVEQFGCAIWREGRILELCLYKIVVLKRTLKKLATAMRIVSVYTDTTDRSAIDGGDDDSRGFPPPSSFPQASDN